MKAKLMAIAALAALSAGAAYAGEVENGVSLANIVNDTVISNDIHVRGWAWAGGYIPINSESSAVVDSGQRATGESVHVGSFSTNAATMNGNALKDATGNIGVNVSAGAGNAQSNDAALAAVDAQRVFASAMAFNKQNASGDSVFLDPFALNKAAMSGNALQGARGNIGVNIAAGAGNLQENGLAASTNSSGTIAKATIDNDQMVTGDSLSLNNPLFCNLDPTNAASLSGNALQGASGNIGVNIAAGASNLQHNGLAIATATSVRR